MLSSANMTTEGHIRSNSNGTNSTQKLETLATSDADGYDIPVYGLDNGTFYYVHITAIVCVVSSSVCATLSMVLSFRHQKAKQFYKTWSKSDRFVVYLAVCDSLFNLSRLLEHSQMLITKDHIHPKELCDFYGFNLMMFVTAQILLVNTVAVNIFMLMYCNINLNFGRSDWKLLLWIFAVPFVATLVTCMTKQFGPAGFYCGPSGTIVLWLNTIPLLLIIAINIVLYALTWKRIYQHVQLTGRSVGPNIPSAKASSRAARSMSLFVAAFFIQWGPLAIYSVWALLTTTVPLLIVCFATISVNVGGCLNLGVFVLIRRFRLRIKSSILKHRILTASSSARAGTNNTHIEVS